MKFACAIVLGVGISVHGKTFDAKVESTWELYGDYAPGIAKFGEGYDLLFGNPLSARGTADPGFKTRGVFKLTFNQGLVTSDGRWNIPDFTTVDSIVDQCSTRFNSDEMTGVNKYVANLRQIDQEISDTWDVPFRASQAFKNFEEVTTANHTVVVQTFAECESYSVAMDLNVDLPLSQDFLAFAMELPAEYSPEYYYELVKRYGTHVISGLRLGARAGQQATFNEVDYLDLIQSGSSIQAKAEYAALIAAGHGDLLTSAQQEEGHHFASKAVYLLRFTLGGKYAPNVTEWMNTASATPMPAHLELASLDTLFTNRWMDPEKYPGAALKRDNVKRMLSSYCDLTFGEVKMCEPFQPDRPVPV